MLEVIGFYSLCALVLYIVFRYQGVNLYGFMLLVGINLYDKLLRKDPFINTPQLYDITGTITRWAISNGILCARILWFLEYYNEVTWYDFINIRVPGFSLLGAMIGIIITVFVILCKQPSSIKILILDRMALYAPLLISFGRIGCFLVGCCYGTPTDVPWSVCYTDPHCLAPCGINLHPVQLYSALLLFLIFIVFYSYYRKKDGQGDIFFKMMIAILSERFLIDFFRDDRTMAAGVFSLHQVIALMGIALLIVGRYKIKRT